MLYKVSVAHPLFFGMLKFSELSKEACWRIEFVARGSSDYLDS
jgi:hypothetical protein